MKSIFAILFLLLMGVTAVHAQSDVEQAIKDYRFDDAMTMLTHLRAQNVKNNLPTDSIDQLLAETIKAQNSMNAIARTVIIDSIACPKDSAYNYIHLSNAIGQLKTARYSWNDSTLNGAIFQPQLADRMYFSQIGNDSLMHIYIQYAVKGNWEEKAPLAGLSDEECTEEDYPFMMTDGLTFYFSQKSKNGMGGFDIYKTRYDIDEHRFLKPENIGMPFNSPANDYLFTIDEERNIGWFVTDRGMGTDSVIVYTFIPETVRNIYNSQIYSTEQLRHLGRIDDIRATWTDSLTVAEAKAKAVASPPLYSHDAHRWAFPVNPTTTYHELSDFKSPEAEKAFAGWNEGNEQLESKQKELDELRKTYTTNNSADIRKLILADELQISKLKQEQKDRERNIRRLENQALSTPSN